MESLEGLRRQIKAWEHEFAQNNGRTPSKDDIRKDSTTKELYKQYHRLKKTHHYDHDLPKRPPNAPLSPRQENLKHDTNRTPSKRYNGTSSITQSTPTKTPVKTPTKTPLSNVITDLQSGGELGPTPQANGKVLLIFDIQTSVTPPETLDSKRNQIHILSSGNLEVSKVTEAQDLLPFKTPTKPSRIGLVHASSSSLKPSLLLKLTQASSLTEIAATPAIIRQSLFLITGQLNRHHHDDDYNYGANLGNYNKSSVGQENPTTPTKGGVRGSVEHEPSGKGFQISPSPLKLHRYLSFGESKQMVNLFKDYESIQKEELEYEADEMENHTTAVESGELENGKEEAFTGSGFKRKAKTQKRTTRNWHIKPRVEVEQDVMQGRTVQEVMKELELEHEELEEESEVDSDEELQLQKEAALNAKDQEKGKRKPVSMNYKRYKINDPRTKAFKRRMRR